MTDTTYNACVYRQVTTVTDLIERCERIKKKASCESHYLKLPEKLQKIPAIRLLTFHPPTHVTPGVPPTNQAYIYIYIYTEDLRESEYL